jgi:hypothetical protein
MTNFDLKVYQGATYSLGMTIRDAQGNPIDLTGLSFRGQIRKTVSSQEIAASFQFQVQDQITNPGKVTCFIPAEDTAAIQVAPSASPDRKITRMAYDIESEDGDGLVVRWLQGVAEIIPEATK